MTDLVKRFANEALLLPREDRAALADILIESLNLPGLEEIDKMWAEEAEKRVEEIKTGKKKPIDGKEVFSEIRNRYKR